MASTSVTDRQRDMTFTDYQSSPATMRSSGVHDTLQIHPGKPRPINPMAGAFSFALAWRLDFIAVDLVDLGDLGDLGDRHLGLDLDPRRNVRWHGEWCGLAGRKRPHPDAGTALTDWLDLFFRSCLLTAASF
jgi:hypothetical protein